MLTVIANCGNADAPCLCAGAQALNLTVRTFIHASGRSATNRERMNVRLTIRALAVTAILATSACKTVIEERKPTTTSTTTTEQTISRNPMRDSTTTETTRTQTR